MLSSSTESIHASRTAPAYSKYRTRASIRILGTGYVPSTASRVSRAVGIATINTRWSRTPRFCRVRLRLVPGVSPRVFRTPEDEEDSIFNYTETASDRVGIGALTGRFLNERIAIIGVGGTGSYVLDLVAKTPVREIRLFDSDEFLQHNAFRAPGAPSIEELREAPRKVEHFAGIYSKMHRGITTFPSLYATNVGLLDGITFAFLCMDAGETKRAVVNKLEALGVSFIDVGMGLELIDCSLGGILRITASTSSNRAHARKRLSFSAGGEKDVYSSNIQVADLNALNAALAVIRWKKFIRFYRDLEGELHITYTTDGNMLLNGDDE
jgi:hypothetical protein